MRKPSIHITEDNLSKVIAIIGKDNNLNKIGSKKLAKLITYHSRNISCNSRSLHITNQLLERKANKVTLSSKRDALLLSDLLYMTRKKLKHKGISKIKEGDRDWTQLKKLTKLCVDFCNEFEIEKREGFLQYINLGLKRISSIRQYISKLINMYETICNDYSMVIEIEEDSRPTETLEIHDLYCSLITKHTGTNESYVNNPLKYVYFKRVRELTDEIDIPHDIYLKAQFYGLAWANSYPDPHNLIGDKANERLTKYMFENKLTKGKGGDTKEDAKSILAKLKG